MRENPGGRFRRSAEGCKSGRVLRAIISGFVLVRILILEVLGRRDIQLSSKPSEATEAVFLILGEALALNSVLTNLDHNNTP
jgi:hypothetical protein